MLYTQSPLQAQTTNDTTLWDMRVDSLLTQAPSPEYLMRVVNLIFWQSEILEDIPSISPVRKAETRNIANAISSPFGSRVHPIFMTKHQHSGIDIPGNEKDTIYASGNGWISEIGFDKRLGGFIRIMHKYDLMSVYGHMRKALCYEGDSVRIGQPIGLMGTTGSSTGPHLHYSVKYKDSYTNPIPFCYLMFDYLKRRTHE